MKIVGSVVEGWPDAFSSNVSRADLPFHSAARRRESREG